ncbi:MAG: HEPN domain-containing protein [Candidatus Bathyarchaeia archaeon]
MAESKVEVLLRVSEVNLVRAQKRFDAGEYDSAVFHASVAVECAANALILRLGGSEAKGHRAISGLSAVLRRVKPEWLREEECVQMVKRGRQIQREVVYARYPLKVAGGWVSPMEYYTREKAGKITEDTRFVVDGIKVYLKRATEQV